MLESTECLVALKHTICTTLTGKLLKSNQKNNNKHLKNSVAGKIPGGVFLFFHLVIEFDFT